MGTTKRPVVYFCLSFILRMCLIVASTISAVTMVTSNETEDLYDRVTGYGTSFMYVIMLLWVHYFGILSYYNWLVLERSCVCIPVYDCSFLSIKTLTNWINWLYLTKWCRFFVVALSVAGVYGIITKLSSCLVICLAPASSIMLVLFAFFDVVSSLVSQKLNSISETCLRKFNQKMCIYLLFRKILDSSNKSTYQMMFQYP